MGRLGISGEGGGGMCSRNEGGMFNGGTVRGGGKKEM